MSGSSGYACADGPLEGVVLMLTTPTHTSVGSLWTVAGPNGPVCVHRFAGTYFEFVEEPLDVED